MTPELLLLKEEAQDHSHWVRVFPLCESGLIGSEEACPGIFRGKLAVVMADAETGLQRSLFSEPGWSKPPLTPDETRVAKCARFKETMRV